MAAFKTIHLLKWPNAPNPLENGGGDGWVRRLRTTGSWYCVLTVRARLLNELSEEKVCVVCGRVLFALVILIWIWKEWVLIMPNVTINSLKEENDTLEEQIAALKQNFEDLQEFFRQNDAPTFRLIPRLQPRWNFMGCLTKNWTNFDWMPRKNSDSYNPDWIRRPAR